MTLTELRKQRDDKRTFLATIFSESLVKADDGSKQYDFRKVTSLKDGIENLEGKEKSVKVAEKVRELNAELDTICKEVETLEAAEKAAGEFSDRENERKGMLHPTGRERDPRKERKSIGQAVVEHEIFKKWCSGSMDGKIVLKDAGLAEIKALFQTTAGWQAESTRTGIVVDAVTRPLQILDIMPTGQTGQPNVVYMEETTRTHASAEVAEGALKPESAFALTERTTPVREIADSIPVTDIQLEDVPMVQSYLDGRLRFGVRQRLDNQVVAGDGLAPNLEGILNVTGIQTQARGTDPVPDAIFKAGTLVRVTGRAVPTHVLLHPNDWQGIRLLRTSDGIYIWGSPSEAGPERIWGWPVIQNEVLTENTGLIGSFEPAWITLFERRDIVVERGFVGNQFRENRATIRASMRAALAVFRPAAFATITGI